MLRALSARWAGLRDAHGPSRDHRGGVFVVPPVVLLVLLGVFATVGASSPPPGQGGIGSGGDAPGARQQSLYVTVRHDKQFVKGLLAENFEVYEGGERRPFELRESEAARIALLVEHSPATASQLSSVPYVENDLLSAMRGFEQAAPPDHWYALAAYGDELTIAQDFTKRRRDIIQTVLSLRLPVRRDIATNDAIYALLDTMSLMSGRRALIVIGSGLDSSSRRGQSDLLRRVDSSGVVVFALGTLSQARRSFDVSMAFGLELKRRQVFLGRLAERSGGFARFPLAEVVYVESMAEILAAIDAQYELVYSPASGSETDPPEIEVKAFRTAEDGSRDDLEVSTTHGRSS